MEKIVDFSTISEKYQHQSKEEKQQYLTTLGELFIQFNHTEEICTLCKPIILDIVQRAKENVEKTNENCRQRKYQQFCVALSQAISLCPDIHGFAVDYLQKNRSFLLIENKRQHNDTFAVKLAEAAWQFVCHLGDRISNIIQLEDVLNFLHQYEDHPNVKWFCLNTLAEMLHMTTCQRDQLLQTFINSEETVMKLKLRHTDHFHNKDKSEKINIGELSTEKVASLVQSIADTDLHREVVMVAGILLPKITVQQEMICSSSLVPVPSMINNLRSLSLAIASASPVLLQGPVGCGKTSLVEHVASLTGRKKSPFIIKIQLGDQTDSKALLGTYRCTDVPGEFVWQPGILTQAVKDGHWIVLEDIDYAPMDVVSVLLPLLERNVLSVPGHGNNIQAAPGFRLFATQRLLGSTTGWHRQQSSSSVLLEKMWTKLNVEPLSRTELEQVINTKYPQLGSVVDKLLDIYFMLSAGKHELYTESITEDTEGVSTVGKFLSNDGRLISTRDLMNWCGRIAADFDVTSTATANLVLQEALDCFVSCLANPQKRVLVAEAIGAKLNITKVKAEYYCSKYKPMVEVSTTSLSVGRVKLNKLDQDLTLMMRKRSTFSFTRQSSVLLERVAICVDKNEPVLLVGETGTGKTSSVQYLAEQIGHTLKVINMNQQSDSADLLGGFKPVDMRQVVKPFREKFEVLFCETFSRTENIKFLNHTQECFTKRKWKNLFALMEHTITPAVKRGENGKISPKLHKKWTGIKRKLQQLKVQVQQSENVLAFSFIEGTLVKALRKGHWVLLDEINLAAAETLECLSGLLESQAGSIVLTERGDLEPIIRDENFRLFACMNPATDVGKKDLPVGIRNRFTELFVDELEDPQDLKILVGDYLRGLSLTVSQVDGIVNFYLKVKKAADEKLTDGTGHKPHFSLRTLCRALRYASTNPCGQVSRSLYEGFCLSFLTQLDRSSHPVVELLICQHIIGKANIKSLLKQPLPIPLDGKYLNFEGYWISVGKTKPVVPENYILTPSVRANLRDLARVVSAGQHPVLLQGETSVGKTSLVTWLAQSSGNVCVRVNNHEHTDLQEYVGCYAADESGKLVFKEGVLVEAMRKGQWIILDELNLAPTDVLEALNRLLDDNRELFIPETQETVKAHPKFMLFATQNPPGHYGGRKMLSRAFRNRFIELHFDEIPSGELETILHKRCDLPLSYAKKLVAAMLDLQTRRRGSGVFAGKQGFMTLRDLFRWAERYKSEDVTNSRKFYDWDQHMADHGFMLLAGRVRKPEEVVIVQEVVKKHLKRSADPEKLFCLTPKTSATTIQILKKIMKQSPSGFGHIVWTYGMRRLAVLIGQAIQFNEPILLVGDTGCGKTTMCQLYSSLHGNTLHSINCHLHTESADFLGGLRPCRSHEQGDKETERKFFEWIDGPLVEAMKEGSMFLIDEISLADDSVLERLNSVLEPERTLLLAEKGGGDGSQNDVEVVKAKTGFQVFATMNPGGDFGKKELSPALRNRFTEIWCPQSNVRQDLINIIEHNLKSGIHLCNQEDGTSGIGRAIMDFVEWFSNNDIGKRCTVSIRDILSWVTFINTCSKTLRDDAMETDSDSSGYNRLDPAFALIHGACLVFLDGIGAGTTSRGKDAEVEYTRNISIKYLLQLVSHMTHQSHDPASIGLLDKNAVSLNNVVKVTEDTFCIWPFSIPKGLQVPSSSNKYALQAPTTCVNAQRILRALQLPRPLLLEGSPGVGKTSLVAAIAKAAGCELVRINLSEQTDVTDLFGADLPVEGAEGGVFAWRDGPLLKALKMGHWVVLDELNLASQSVLEGLNACLDHRAEVYIPELGKSFHIQHEKTRLFACQNPLNQGGGRKGLPRSFLNRFTQVYVEPLTLADLLFILKTMYPIIPTDVLTNMVRFNMQIYQDTVVDGHFGQRGGPWEFNLRDLFRWCDLLLANQGQDMLDPGEYFGLLYKDRMRTVQDKQKVMDLYGKVFQVDKDLYSSSKSLFVTESLLQVGHSFVKRQNNSDSKVSTKSPLHLLHHCLEPLESVMKCVEMNWMSILVGPQSCGKTSLIQVLSHLTGHRLHVLAMNSAMDTTELLGGFEQADNARHLDEIAADLEEIVEKIEVKLLLGKSTAEVIELQKKVQQYKVKDKQGEHLSSIEELQLLKDKHLRLSEMYKQCKLLAVSGDNDTDLLAALSHVENTLVKLGDRLKVAKPGTGGGTFEWVDSILVQALQSGDWLLIDNVNFCSPSVLDRLNALLEPNGELSINERGVIDGEIPTVKPHPNFRLFLTMDPKFGEISRAMRNRGVEIYIPGEEEGSPYSDHDVKVMLHGVGLINIQVCDWLISLHEDMRCNLTISERSNILDLLHASLITMQQTNRGIPLAEALRHATCGVYVKSVKNIAANQLATEIWQKHCNKLGNVSTKIGDQTGTHKVGVASWCRDTALANVNQHGSPLSRILSELLQEENLEGERIDLKMRQLKFALSLFINLASACDWSIHAKWLSSIFEKFEIEIRKKINKTQRKKLQKHMTEFRGVCEKTFSGVRTIGFLTDSKEICDMMKGTEVTGALLESPLDARWNQQCLEMNLSKLESQSRPQCRHHLEAFYNRFHLVTSVIRELYTSDVLLERLKKFLDATDVRMLSHKVFTDLHCLMNQKQDLVDILNQLRLSDFHQVVQILDGFKWWTRLLEVVVECTKSEDIHKLTLYWSWFRNKFLPYISNSIPPAFQSIITQVQRNLGQDDHKAKQFTKYWNSCGHPLPYQTESEAHLTFSLLDLLKVIDIKSCSVDLIINTRVKMQLNEGTNVNRIIMCCFEELGHGIDPDTVNKVTTTIDTIYRSISKFGIRRRDMTDLTSMETDQPEMTGDSTENTTTTQISQHVELWPMLEYTRSLAVIHFVNKILRNAVCIEPVEWKEDSMEAMKTFSLSYTPVDPQKLSHLDQIVNTDSKEKKKEMIQLILNDMYQEMWKMTTGCQIDKWLNWNITGTDEHHDTDYGALMGPSCLHKAVVSYCGFSYICRQQQRVGKKSSMSPSDLQHMQVPLGQYHYHLQKLQFVSSHTWIHAALLGSPSYHVKGLEQQHLRLLFLHVLQAVKVFFHNEELETFSKLVYEIQTVESNSQERIQFLLEQCLKCLKGLMDSKSEFVLTSCGTYMKSVLCQRNLELCDLGAGWVYLGLLSMLLLTPSTPVDPVEKVAIKLGHLRQEMEEIETELDVRCTYHQALSGSEVTVLPEHLLHPHITYLLKKRVSLQEQIHQLEAQQAYRPTKSQFRNLVSDIHNYLESVGSVQHVTGLLNKLLGAQESAGSELAEEKMWQKTQTSFIDGLETKYPLYRDITVPFIVSVHQIMHGMRLVASSVEKSKELKQLQSKMSTTYSSQKTDVISQKLIVMSKFPSVSRSYPNNLELVKSLTSENTYTIVKAIIDNVEEDLHVSKDELISRLRHSMLLHVRNEGFMRKELTEDLTYTFSMLLHQFVLSWQHQEELKRKKEADNSLYRYKSQIHGDEREHDEIEESEFRESFPTFEKDFQDVIGPQSLDDDSNIESTDTSEMVPGEIDGALTDDEMVKVCYTHQLLFKTLATADWIQQSHVTDIKMKDIIEPALNSYIVAASLGKLCLKTLSKDLDDEIPGGHLLASFVLQEQITPSLLEASQFFHTIKYDIYHDPNVAEVVKCPAVLQRLVGRIKDLLVEWPDHPTLLQLTQIVDRILSFPITSPVIKFLTGLELLLEKAQDWESNAAKYVSMATELGEVSSLILEWRKMELSCWNQCLDVVLQRQAERASKWWFHLYQLIEAEPDSEQETEDNHAAVLKTLKEFVEKSNLGEYEARLDMLKSFHCQLVYMPKTKKNDYLLNLLWNLHQFYKQFSAVVSETIQKLRSPIEKELKGFVKIARWTDMNYWALKQTTEKTHRTLHKHMKAFQAALEQPVQGILCESDPKLESVSEDEVELWREQFNKTVQNISKVPLLVQGRTTKIPALEGLNLPLQRRLDSLCIKIGKHWKSVAPNLRYGGLAMTLDDFTGEVIESVHELQTLQVSQHEDKEKQKSEAKHIGQRKRKALSDLFKYLVQIGLSHRKGLLTLGSDNVPLLVQPLDISVLLHRQGQNQRLEHMCNVWGRCQKYYYKCIARKARFSSALHSPSQELGVGNIERCKGFIEHLSKVAVDQYSNLSRVSHLYEEIRNSSEILQSLSDISNPLPPQTEVHGWLKTVKDILVSAKEGFSQFEIFLHCCPKAVEELKVHPSPFSKEYLSPMSLCFHGDEQWSSCLSIIKHLYKVSSSLYDDILPLSRKNLFQWDDLLKIGQAYEQMWSFDLEIQNIERAFSNQTNDRPPKPISSIIFLREEIKKQNEDYKNWIDKVKLKCGIGDSEMVDDTVMSDISVGASTVVEKFARSVEDFVASILLTVQTLRKSHTEHDAQLAAPSDDDDLQDGHLVSLMTNKLMEDTGSLQLVKVTQSLHSLIHNVVSMSESNDELLPVSVTCARIMSQCVPLVQQYVSIVEYFLLHLLVVNKTTSKLLSVLLGVFTELVTKGFCTPAEFADEMEGDGATEFEDIEGGGMGEGEGMKDVSDQIETEDQLDEAQKPGEKKEDDTSEKPDIASEENAIEMSDDLDGKLHDLEAADQEERSDDENGNDEDELDKQMGEVDEKDVDKLDEQMWGSDEEESNDNDESKEEFGPGAQQENKKELVAKDDNQDKSEADNKGDKDKDENVEEENDEDKKPHELEQFDESEYDDNKIDPNRQQKEPEQQPEIMDLPDDLNLDEMEDGKDEEPTAGQDENEETKAEAEDAAEEDKVDDNEKENVDDAVDEESSKNEQELDANEEDGNKEVEDNKMEEGDTHDNENDPGFTAQDNSDDDEERNNDMKDETEDKSQQTETYGNTTHDSQNAEQSETAADQAGKTDNDQDESEGTGKSYSENLEGHQGQSSSKVAHGSTTEMQKKPLKRKPGISSSDRTLGSTEQKFKKLKTCDEQTTEKPQNENEQMEADLYEHIKDAESRFDAQTLDVATAEQQAQQPVPNKDMEETDDKSNMEDVEMRDEEEEAKEDMMNIPEKLSSKSKNKDNQNSEDKRGEGEDDEDCEAAVKHETEGDYIQTMNVARRPESTIHTTMENLYLDSKEEQLDIEKLRSELEEQLTTILHVDNTNPEADSVAAEAWHKYESLTSSLSQELCEQLRLVLEPSQATKLKGDYRTGKRLNMRKVIPYIASQFRKDKIWLRRTKPSKRQYQIMLAIDDSSSMVDNHSKQLAFESLAMISNALTLLESGELAICSFGESVKLLHPFTEQFTSQSGASLLQHFTFEQKKTKVAQLLRIATSHMLEARSRQHGAISSPETAQLLLIVSDGRGLFAEGMETVKSAVRQSRQANVFVVFVVIDNPQNKDSILDIKVPVFKSAGQMPEIKSYMDHFPFPFYILLRDINSLPHVLCDALRQWFELVTSVDR